MKWRYFPLQNVANLLSRFSTQISEGSEGLNSKFCWVLCVLGVFFQQNSLNFFIRFINQINLLGISRHFCCCLKVRRSHACHGIYFLFHGNTRDMASTRLPISLCIRLHVQAFAFIRLVFARNRTTDLYVQLWLFTLVQSITCTIKSLKPKCPFPRIWANKCYSEIVLCPRPYLFKELLWYFLHTVTHSSYN